MPGTAYSVSSCGKFRNDNRNTIKKLTTDRHGYLTVNLHSKTYLAHRVVAKVWLDDFYDQCIVNHLDFDRKNNNAENLEITTIRGNAEHSAKAGRYTKTGESNNNCKVSNDEILTIWTYLNMGLNCTEISKTTGRPRKYINDVKLGKIRNIWKI